ncbi:MAG: pyridoxal 5'-phosphate synthase glutaminase subunit PdxT, partial [Chloroflexi bacterium]|nr:pyridoxal 5'-phosphate synthase glutaminase subunit PdxT [Chloroflexota bacterium]
VPVLGDEPLHAVFIRAPLITRVGDGVEVLATLPDGRAVAARQDNLLVSSFHPELTDDNRLHRYFVERVVSRQPSAISR